jgi:L-fuculose-phosphate aldolase
MAYNATGRTTDRVSEWKIREQMCDIGRRIWLKGFCAGNEGNHSYRLGPNRFLCTPTGISKGVLKPDDLCTVDGEGKQIAGRRKRSSEFLMHAAVYKERPDINAVIHSHPPHATAFAVAGVDLPTCIHPEAEVFLGPVKTAKYVTPGDERLGETLKPFLKDSNTILLGNHGAVCFDADLEQCYYRLEIVDAYARLLILAKQIGSVQPLSAEHMRELLELKREFGVDDSRIKDLASLTCQSDFVSRVGGEVGARGRMMAGSGTAASPIAGQASAVSHAVRSGPQQYSADEIDQLVQVITDEIMATVA